MTPDRRDESPLVSVIVPSYNHARYVVDCLESVATDPYPAKELVVIDDGSTDGSPEIIEAWRRTTVPGFSVRFTARENRGLATTLAELITLAKGPLVIPLASDDMLFPGGIGCRVDYLESHPAIDAVFGDCEVIGVEGELLFRSGLSDLHGVRKRRLVRHLRAEIIGNWGVPGPVLMYRRSGLLAIGGYDPSLVAEDWNLFLGFVSRRRLAFVDHIVGRYRVHDHNTMSESSMQFRITRDLLDTAHRHLEHFGLTDRYRLFQQILSINGRLAKQQGNRLAWAAYRGLAAVMKLPLLLWDWTLDHVGSDQ